MEIDKISYLSNLYKLIDLHSMREVVFSDQNNKRWKTVEAYLQGKVKFTSDQLANHYILLNDDLSYVRTFYPKSNIVTYLNKLALDIHQKIYQNKRENKSRFLTFFRYEVPLAIRQSHKELFYALAIFVVAIAVGAFSSIMDDEFVRLILGDYYVNMTIENINNEDPMAIYKSASESNMFLGIATNNIRVSFLAFAFGIFASMMTGFILFSNGVMVGAFQYFFIKHGLFWTSFSTIFIHGTLELSAIVIAGGAGIVIGNSWMFPGTYSRKYALINGARRGLKIIIGLVPVFIMAALLEATVTRHYMLLGSAGRLAIILISLTYIIWYFIIYPIQLEKNGLFKSVSA